MVMQRMPGSRAARANNEDRLGTDPLAGSSSDDGLSLDSISEAYAAMLAGGDDPYRSPVDAEADPLLAQANEALSPDAGDDAIRTAADCACEISPRSILEAMLFVGTPDNRTLSSEQIAAMMRGVRPAEIDELVADLNRQYHGEGRPYKIVAVGVGYRLALCEEFAFMRERLYGRPRAARLSPAAVEVLAIVAYNEPVTAEQVTRMRGAASGPVLAQLVRRELVRLERANDRSQPARYFTTPRFLQVFGLANLQELPRSREIE
jgi:segregation and condensation protein B